MATERDESYWTGRIERLIRRGRCDVIVRWLRAAGRPTRDARAAGFWRIVSGHWAIRGDQGAALYRAAGYKPYCGFPLERA